MPSKSSGRIVKARKYSTPHQKNHRYETFTAKIAKFNSLQPLRKVRRHDLDKEDLSAEASYFRTTLQKWNELNISQGFVGFKREVLSVSESLPQILHFEKRIMASFVRYMSMQEKESLEPLLELLTAFAHDLGVRFEKYYAQSLALIVDIAGKPQDADVIEWTFGALAFLFKYLSKLIVSNLRPTYDVIAPLLGKARNPPHIARFAAEALSFLVKKAGAPSHRETALPSFIQHVRADLCQMTGDRQFMLYKDGIMTLFAEAIKGNDHTIHSSGTAVLTHLMDGIFVDENGGNVSTQDEVWTEVVCGVLTSIIHHSTPETFPEFLDAVVEKTQKMTESCSEGGSWWNLRPLIRILGVLSGVRKGSRIENWGQIVQTLNDILEHIAKFGEDQERSSSDAVWRDVMVSISIIWHNAPTDALIPRLSAFTRSLTKGPLMGWFIPFCVYLSDLNAARFGSLLRSEFQRFIAAHWSQGSNQETLCICLPQMIENQAFPPAGERECCRLPQDWQDQIVSKFENLEISPFPERGPYNKDPQVWRDRCLPKYSALLRLLELASVHPSTNARIAELLLRKLKLALRPSSTLASDEVHFIVSQGFHAYLRMSKAGDAVDGSLSPLLRAAVPRFARSVGFLEAYLAYEQHMHERGGDRKTAAPSSDSSTSEEDPVVTSLVENLSSPSHNIRLASLKLLKQMNNLQGSQELVDIMIDIEQLPLSLESTRTIAMLLRKLGQKHSSLDESTWLQRGIPNFAFGMLTVKLAPVWDHATEALQQISETKAGEEIVCDIAFKWVDVQSPRWAGPSSDNLSSNREVVTDFDCTFLRGLLQRAEEVHRMAEPPDNLMLQKFDERQHTADSFMPNARSRALKVFNAIPSMSERRSRRLVPYFLPWALEDEHEVIDNSDPMDDSYWSLADRKSLLGVFSQFINPRVLYLHGKVYDGLLQQLENGDVEVQKLALKAILAWKQEGVKTYQEHLEYLLDEARFKNELTVFLQGNSVIKSEHRAELMPVLLRLLYGRTISKKGVGSGKHGLQATRLTVLRNLSVEDMGSFLDVASGKLKNVKVVDSATSYDKLFEKAIIPPRKQVGFLNMISTLIAELGTNVLPYMQSLLNAVLYCLVFSCRQLSTAATAELAEDTEEPDDHASTQSMLKTIRTSGIKCLVMLFQNAQDFQWEPFHGIIIEEVVAPRLDQFPTEMAQGVSGILQLLSTWSNLPKAALMLGPHGDSLPRGVLPKVIECLAADKTKEEVQSFILQIIQNLVRLALAPAHESEYNELIKSELLDPNANAILDAIANIVKAPNTSNDLLEHSVEALLALAKVLHESERIEPVLRLCSFLLEQPPRRVNPRIKGRVLLVVENFSSLIEPGTHQSLCDDTYVTLAGLFSYFKDRENRQALCRALATVSTSNPGKTAAAQYCTELNAFKPDRIDEPDYDRRLAAYNAISREREVPLAPQEWLPLLHNCLFFLKADEEFGVLATNSADSMRRFVHDIASCKNAATRGKLEEQLTEILMPAMYAGVRESSETIRREVLRVFGYIVGRLPDWETVKDLRGLLEDTSEDASEPLFFFSILSPAVSRQLEALQALLQANKAYEMSSQNIAQFFIPLLEHFIYGRAEGTDDHGLGAEARNVIGRLAESLHWKHYRSTLQRYIGYVGSRPEQQKQTIRLLGNFTDAVNRAAKLINPDAMDTEGPGLSPTAPRLAQTMPAQAQLSKDIVDYFLPLLMKHLHEKDESEVSYRVPVGVTIVKLLKLLPTEQMDQKLAGVLTDICHILRSKAWEAREMTRETLVDIATSLGPAYFGFLLKELRSALTKGYQLHVLSYTIHSILLAVIPISSPGDLDYCLRDIMTVIMDDIFGVIGQEKDAEGYTTQMKEVKSSKSQDSMELVAKNASVTHLINLVRPLQALLMQKVNLKILRKIDILMGRIASGLLQNPGAETRDTLVFCYEVIQEVYKCQEPQKEEKIDPRVRKYLVQRGVRKTGERGRTTRNTYKLMRFAIDILRSMFKKHDNLRTPENISGFLPLLGDAVIDGEDETKISTFRLLAVIVKVPFAGDEGTNIYKVAVKEATKVVSTSVSTTTELSQAALKMLAVVLRDRKDVIVKEAAVDMLLEKLKDDLTEPQYRHVTFNFLRSVLERRVETAAVYDTMDYVGTVMITNDDKDTRDLARGAFFQFIRDYPQKKARWAKQLNFVVANLKYEREGGRLSVMEVVHLLLMKSPLDFVQEIAATCFLPLFFVLANDDSDKCCQAAGELIKEIFRRSDKGRTQDFLALLRSWLDKEDNPAVFRLALRLWSFYFECSGGAAKNQKDFKLVFAKVMGLLSSDKLFETDGPLVQAGLGLLTVLLEGFPEKLLSGKSEVLWTHVSRCMGHPDQATRLASIRLISLYLADFAQNTGSVHPGETVTGSHGLELDSIKVESLVRLAANVLNGYNVDEALANEAGQLLIFLAPRLATPTASVEALDEPEPADEDNESEDDQPKRKDLQYLFWRLSHVLRKEIRPTAVAIAPKVVAMEVLETICRRTAGERLEPSFKTILLPLHNITDPTIRPPKSMDEVFNSKHEHLKTRAQILMDALQKKFGTAEYSKQLMAIREEVRARRQQRSAKRKIEALAQPEKYGRDKRKKFEKNRERKKVRSKEQKVMRQTYKNW